MNINIQVHHIKRLKINNVNDVSICINPDNLELLCKDCHNKEHNRFSNIIRFDKKGNII